MGLEESRNASQGAGCGVVRGAVLGRENAVSE